RRGGPGGGGARPRARADARPGRDAGAARRGRGTRALLRAGQALPGARDHARARRALPRRTALRAPRPRGDAGDRHRPAHRDHQGDGAVLALSPEGLAVRQPRATTSLTAIPGAAATPGGGDCAVTRPDFPSLSPRTRGESLTRSSFALASRIESPTTFGTTPWIGFASTSVTLSNDDSRPFAGYCCRTMSTRCFGSAGL